MQQPTNAFFLIIIAIPFVISLHSTSTNVTTTNDTLSFFGRTFLPSTFRFIQESIDCWSKNGSWFLQNKTIIDDISLYRACHRFISYGPKNPCSLLLDFNALKYKWKSAFCPALLLPFTTERFCEVMKDQGNITIVGDSINKQLHVSIKEAYLLDSKQQCTNVTDIHIFSCPDYNITVSFYRNDLLSLITTNESLTHHAQEKIWITNLPHSKPSLLLLNRGAHFENDDKLITDINQTISYIRRNYPHTSIIWRNTPPGINFRASVFRAPLTAPPSVIPHRYHWHEFDRQNMLVRHFLQTYYPETLLLDVATPTSLRQDAHYDELHYCIPGPVSLWVDLLVSALQLISTFATS